MNDFDRERSPLIKSVTPEGRLTKPAKGWTPMQRIRFGLEKLRVTPATNEQVSELLHLTAKFIVDTEAQSSLRYGSYNLPFRLEPYGGNSYALHVHSADIREITRTDDGFFSIISQGYDKNTGGTFVHCRRNIQVNDVGGSRIQDEQGLDAYWANPSSTEYHVFSADEAQQAIDAFVSAE